MDFYQEFYQEMSSPNSSYSPVFLCIVLALLVISIVSFWAVFKKAKQPGWKILIPVYNEYIVFKIAWKPAWFVANLLLSLASAVLLTISGISLMNDPNGGTWMLFLSMGLLFLSLIIHLILTFKLSRAFGHGAGYGLGLVFLTPIFLLILAFGKSQYVRKSASSESDDGREAGEKHKPSSFKDFFYDKNDIIVVLIIVVLAALIIAGRIEAIMDYPKVLAERAAATETKATTETSEADTASQSDNGSSSAASTVSVTIADSDTAATVSQKLQSAGLISSSSEFQSYINSMNKTNALQTGTFQIPSDSSDAEILDIITN